MVFVSCDIMYLTAPTVEELKGSDLSDLLEMLVKQINDYNEEIKREGLTSKSRATRELIVNIQSAIQAKKRNP